jgi:hypothetical protein
MVMQESFNGSLANRMVTLLKNNEKLINQLSCDRKEMIEVKLYNT